MQKRLLSFALFALLIGAAAYLALPAKAIYIEGQDNSASNASSSEARPALLRVENENAKAELEKILSPDKIKQYRDIIKRGNELWGVRKPQADNPGLSKAPSGNKMEKVEAKASSSLEKIVAPQFIGLYDKIRKIGSALWGEAKKPFRVVTEEQRTCVIAAIDLKDKSVSDNNLKTATDINSAISVRNACQKTALATTTNQMIELHKCTLAFKEARAKVKMEANKVHAAAWKQYKNDLLSCWKATSTAAVKGANFEGFLIEDGSDDLPEMIVNAGQIK